MTRKDSKFVPDPSRVIARFFNISNERSKYVISNVLAMSESEVYTTLSKVLERLFQTS